MFNDVATYTVGNKTKHTRQKLDINVQIGYNLITSTYSFLMNKKSYPPFWIVHKLLWDDLLRLIKSIVLSLPFLQTASLFMWQLRILVWSTCLALEARIGWKAQDSQHLWQVRYELTPRNTRCRATRRHTLLIFLSTLLNCLFYFLEHVLLFLFSLFDIILAVDSVNPFSPYIPYLFSWAPLLLIYLTQLSTCLLSFLTAYSTL